MPAPREVIDLVQRFDNNVESYRSGQYKEAQVRQEFIDPFFKAIGWDMDNAARSDIASVFSRQAILTGSFDKYAADTNGEKGTAEVDAVIGNPPYKRTEAL